jgi:hypothetical protein
MSNEIVLVDVHALEGTLYHCSIARFAFLEGGGHVLTSGHFCSQLSGSSLDEPDTAETKCQERHGHFVNLPPLQISCLGGEPFIHIEETTQGKDQKRDTKNDQNIITFRAVCLPIAPGPHPMPPRRTSLQTAAPEPPSIIPTLRVDRKNKRPLMLHCRPWRWSTSSCCCTCTRQRCDARALLCYFGLPLFYGRSPRIGWGILIVGARRQARYS